MTKAEIIELMLQETRPLQYPRGDRLPLYLWPLHDIPGEDDAELERILQEMDARGIAVISSWKPLNREKSLARALQVGALQKKLGLAVNINANACMHSFFDGDERTAHITDADEPFFDDSFGKGYKMGCPFAVDFRYKAMKEQIEPFVRAYKERDIPINFIYADWEIDGPIEWNNAWENSKRCKRCRENIPDIEDFTEFQKALRMIRSDMQKKVFSDTVLSYFPDALVGNYGVYPHDGYRYWFDFYEKFVEGSPHKTDQRAKYRQWFDEFPLTGYTFAMPTVYAWNTSYRWYNYEDIDFRWFYTMLLVTSNVCKSTPKETPIISFVHFGPISYPDPPDPEVEPFREERYKELLWHMLLRGMDGLFLCCSNEETPQELRPLHEVYAASLQYKDFLDGGEPISFEVPTAPGPVVSGLRLGEKLLVRRTDFTDAQENVTLTIDGKEVAIPRKDGACQIIELK